MQRWDTPFGVDFAGGRRARPVFVDDTGRKRRRFRGACGSAISAFSLYVALVIVGLTGHGPLAGIHLGPFGPNHARSAAATGPGEIGPNSSAATLARQISYVSYTADGSAPDASGATGPDAATSGSSHPGGTSSDPTVTSPDPTEPDPIATDPITAEPIETDPGSSDPGTPVTSPGKSASAPGHNKTATPGKSASAPGQDKTTTTGNSAAAPGQTKTGTAPAPGNSTAAPGQNKTDSAATPGNSNSTQAPGQTKSTTAATPAVPNANGRSATREPRS